MKKILIFFVIVIIIIASISFAYLQFQAKYKEAKKINEFYESYYQKEIYAADLATVINRAMDSNIKKEIEKDETGKYKNNDNNSINIDIKMTDNNKTYNMEKIYNGGIDKFLQAYTGIKFKCIKLEYHKSTNKIKYILFEQITE